MRNWTLILLFFLVFISSCEDIQVEINEVPFVLSGKKVGEEVIKGWREERAIQGCAIKNDVIYIARSGGYCDTFLLAGDEIRFDKTFTFYSSSSLNHANCIQFDPTKTDDTVLFISSHYRKAPCFVERINDSGSHLLQKIYVEEMKMVPNNMIFNLVPGDDNYLWLCGFYDNILRIIKFRKPLLSLQEVTLTSNDILDSWERNDYIWEQEVLQGMKMYNNRLYVVYGGSYNRRGIWVWDTNTHQLKSNLDFTEFTTDEFEDLEIYKDNLYLFVLKDYAIKFPKPKV